MSGEEIAGRKGVKSGSSDRPASDAQLNRTGRSAPTAAPDPRPAPPRKAGRVGTTPTSIESNVIEPPGPRRTGKDPHVGGRA